MQPLSDELAKLGFIVLMVGMPDDDETAIDTKYPDAKTMWAKMLGVVGIEMLMRSDNLWPGAYYSIALSQAIDHMIAVAPAKLGLTVDTTRVGLVGHSMGGGGVLCAAARACRDKICAVVAISPSHVSVEAPFDNIDGCVKYSSGADFSNEHGEGTVAHLADIVAPTLIFGSKAEYNTAFPFSPCWPSFPYVATAHTAPVPALTARHRVWCGRCLFEQLGSSKKELYVDNKTDQAMMEEAHIRLVDTTEMMHEYLDGVPLEVVKSFLRRHVAGSAEAAPTQPASALEWKQQGAVPAVAAPEELQC